MAYNGSVELISGIKPKNGGTFPLVNAPDVQVDEGGTRLDVLCDKIDWLMNGSLDLGFDKVELKRCPTFEPADGYHGRMLEYYVEGWNRWGEKL